MTVVFQENSNVSGYTEYQVKTCLPIHPRMLSLTPDHCNMGVSVSILFLCIFTHKVYIYIVCVCVHIF